MAYEIIVCYTDVVRLVPGVEGYEKDPVYYGRR